MRPRAGSPRARRRPSISPSSGGGIEKRDAQPLAGHRRVVVDGEAAGHLDAHVVAPQHRLDHGVVLVAQPVLELGRPGPGPLDVDLAGQLGHVGEDDHPVVAHLDEAAVHGGLLQRAAIGRVDADLADVEGADEGAWPVRKAISPSSVPAHHHVGSPENRMRSGETSSTCIATTT